MENGRPKLKKTIKNRPTQSPAVRAHAPCFDLVTGPIQLTDLMGAAIVTWEKPGQCS